MAIYEHSKKAGNPADVWKHFLLLTVLREMISRPGSEPFHYRETHAGAGEYLLGRLGEWRQGIGSLLPAPEALTDHPYFRFAGGCSEPGAIYPSSWRLASHLLAEHGRRFRLTLYDNSPAVYEKVHTAILDGRLPADLEFKVEDGYKALEGSPATDLTLIDPPYRPAQRDWLRCGLCATSLSQRGDDYLLWYPLFWPAHPDRLVAAAKAPAYEVHWRSMGHTPTQTLKGCGLVAGGRTAPILEDARPELEAVAALLDGRLVIRS